MGKGLIAGMTDYSHQKLEDISDDLLTEAKYISECISNINTLISDLKTNQYWNKVPDDFKSIVAYALKFFSTSQDEINEIALEINNEVMEHHVTQLITIARVSKELNGDFGVAWHQYYRNKEYGNESFGKVETIYAHGRNMVSDMLDISNMAGRLRDFIGKKSKKATDITKILFILSSPEDLSRIRVDKEVAKIEEQFEAAKRRDSFCIYKREAVKITTITKAVLDIQPNIIHFSGHGDENGIILESESDESTYIPLNALVLLFQNIASNISILFVNSCSSFKIAEEVSKKGIHTIGMTESIDDSDAINFSIGFYQAIGSGADIVTSFNNGLIVMSQNPYEMETPSLWLNGSRLQ